MQKMQLHFSCKEVPQKCRIMQMHESGHSKPAHRQITLILANGHYSIMPNPERRKTNTATFKPKIPLIYQENGVNNTVKVYDGNLIRTINIPEMRKLQSKALFGKWCFIPIKKNKNTGKYETLENAYKRIYEERNVLLEESKKIGLTIDLFICHRSYKKVALWLFEKLSQAIPANKPLDPIEAKWISEAMVRVLSGLKMVGKVSE